MPKLAPLLAQFATAPRRYLQMASGVEEPTGRHGRRYWVVARGLCRFFKVPLSPQTSPSRQLAALDLQIQRLSPFAETGSHWHLGPEFISVWLWDAAAVKSAGEAIGVDTDRMTVLPEPALRPAGDDGARLVETADGVEAQYWSRGAPSASRWWAMPPDRHAWLLFQRGASVGPDQIVALPPPPARLDWLNRPWTQARLGGSFDLGALDLRFSVATVAAVLLLAYGYFGAEWVRLGFERNRAAAAIAAQLHKAEPQIAARSAALDNQSAIAQLRQLDRFPGQLALMARVAGMLPKNETHLTEWNWDSGRLELTVAADHPLDSLFFVRSLERIEGFKGVAVERAGSDNSLRIRLTVEPL